jgi:ESSS subunit of NADH:ubiquinone oxidoreductase (complex I)
MPVPQSAQAQLWQGHPYREGWESTMTWWYGSSLVLLVAILGFAPNTDIESWAKEEAMARLKSKKGGEAIEFGTHSFNIVQENRDTTWDKFAVRAVRMTEDDDDDDDDDDEEEGDEEEDDE